MKIKTLYINLIIFFCIFIYYIPLGHSEGSGPVHTVKKGDTLWSICEKYYGDPFLWPELWEMNKFITNPHWIKPGDAINLLRYKKEVIKTEKQTAKIKRPPLEPLKGIDVSRLTNLKALGFFSRDKAESWGRIFDLKVNRELVQKGETVYVKMTKKDVRPGDKFTVFSISKPVKHPKTGKEYGYINSFNGIMVIEKAERDYFAARIIDSFKAISRGDFLIPYRSVSPCILPVPYRESLDACVIASKDRLNLLGQYSVVYMDAGNEKGIQRGYIFKAIEERESLLNSKTKEKISLPPVIMGKILILSVREHTSTGVVFWSSKEFTKGVKITPHTWEENQYELGSLPTCVIE